MPDLDRLLLFVWKKAKETQCLWPWVYTKEYTKYTPREFESFKKTGDRLGLQHICFGETQALSLKLFSISFLIAWQRWGVTQVMSLWHNFLHHSFTLKYWNNEIISLSLHSRVYCHYKKFPLMPFALSFFFYGKLLAQKKLWQLLPGPISEVIVLWRY